MKLILLSALFFSLLQAQDASTVSGSVVDAATGHGLAGVQVNLTSDQPAYETTTDAAGRFSISGVKPGQYAASFDRPGYMWSSIGAGSGQLRPIHVQAGSDVSNLVVQLAQYGSVEGRVLDPDGNPLAKAEVSLGGQLARTDADGRYKFADVTPRKYDLSAIGPPVDDRPKKGERFELVRTWYPSLRQLEDSQQIDVTSGSRLTGYDIRLVSAPVYRVRGVLLGIDGKPLKGGAVRLGSEDGTPYMININSGTAPKRGARRDPLSTGPLGFFTVTRNEALPIRNAPVVKTSADGTFEFASVPRGPHRIVAAIDSAPNPFASASIASVVVDRDIDDLQIRLEAPVSLEAVAEIAGADAPPAPETISQAAINLAGRMTFAEPDGSIHLRDVAPGEYRITAAPGLPGGYYLSAITLGGRDVSGQPVTLAAGSPPIHLVYKPGGATLHGTVSGGKTAVLIAADSLDSQPQHQGRLINLTDTTEFEMHSLTPGSYFVFATQALLPAGMYDLRNAAKIRASAAVVNVQEGSTSTVTAPLIDFE